MGIFNWETTVEHSSPIRRTNLSQKRRKEKEREVDKENWKEIKGRSYLALLFCLRFRVQNEIYKNGKNQPFILDPSKNRERFNTTYSYYSGRNESG